MKMVSARSARRTGLAGIFAALAVATVGVSTVPAAMAAATDTAAQGRQLFNDWGCNACHVLKDAGAAGHVGPALDRNAKLSKDYITSLVNNGQGAMPGFAGAMTDEEIDILATYILENAAK
ncbi:MAG TPA: cytochrome c [Sphingomonadaceae bacterium]|nr:cytochrome c [Sphingomonadaceae bacterium]